MIELAGGRNLAGETGAHSREISWADVAQLDPDILVIMPCGYGIDASIADADRHAERLQAVAPRAIAEGNAFAVDGSSYFNRSGPRVVDGIEILAGLVHPHKVPAPRAAAATVWHPDAVVRSTDDCA
jgi:iron complex transport system substrate-binding protein